MEIVLGVRQAILVVALVVASGLRAAEETFLGVPESEIRRVVELGYSLNPETEPAVRRLMETYPDSPAPGMLNVGRLYWWQRYAAIDEELSEEFEEEALRVLEKATDFERERRDDLDAQFAVAMVEMSLVKYYVDHKRWWAAFWKTRPSMKAMRRILEEDPQYADAMLPLGMANCYLSDAPGYLKPLAMLMSFSGDLEKGLEYMEGAKRGLFMDVDAQYYLAYVHRELRDDIESARAELGKLVGRFPQNIRFQIDLAEFERNAKDHEASVARLQDLLERPLIREFSAMRLEATLSLCWSALGAERWEVARQASRAAEELARSREALEGHLGWALVANAEATNALGEPGQAIEVFGQIERGTSAYEHAQRRIEQIREARAE